MNPWNQKSLDLDRISRRNHQMNRGEIFENKNHGKTEIKNEIDSIDDSKMKSKAI